MGVPQLAFHLTDRCQLDCRHCLRDPEKRPVDLPVPLIERVLDEVNALHRVRHVSLTGGEPTLHPQFLDVIDAIASREMTWHMVSNGRTFGWLMDSMAARPARRAAFASVNFSLDGADEATHDRIRGEGSFREVLSACTRADASGVPFTVQMVVTALNRAQIDAMGVLAAHLGAERVAFLWLQPTGTHHDAVLGMSPADWRAANDSIDRLAAALRIDIATPEGWPREQPFHHCDVFRSTQLHVDVHGRLNLCCQHAGVPQGESPPSGESDVVADLRESSLAAAHTSLLGVIHRAEAAKLAQIAAGSFGEWDYFACNWCLKHFGKPHWSREGARGPAAERARWVGAWGAPKDQAPRARLPLLR